MPNLKDLTTGQLKRAFQIKEQIEALLNQLDSIEGGGNGVPSPFAPQTRKKRRMSKAGRAAIAAAAKARWAQYRGKGEAKLEKVAKTGKKKRKMSAAAKAKISEAAKARWAKVKLEGKKGL